MLNIERTIVEQINTMPVSEDKVWDLLADITEAKVLVATATRRGIMGQETRKFLLNELEQIARDMLGNRAIRNYLDCKAKADHILAKTIVFGQLQ